VIFKSNPEIVFEQFEAFLNEITRYFVEEFEELFPKESDLRAHFRWYKSEGNSHKYVQLCKFSSRDQDTGNRISDLAWGGLIEQAYEHKKPFIYSVNQKYNKHEPIMWDDFMTIVPRCFESDREALDNRRNSYIRPILTFGISIKNENYSQKNELSKILFILEYLNFDKILIDTLNKFIACFHLGLNDYLKYKSKFTSELENDSKI